mmetsp:Transcript_15997/g.40226  ORF Transcript_15997/g.40226 Transcript_15997/m.40226 type:complete len:310 (+) Transcript_15997:2-931(+)
MGTEALVSGRVCARVSDGDNSPILEARNATHEPQEPSNPSRREDAGAAEAAVGHTLLDEGRLALQGVQGRLQTGNLGLAVCLLVRIGLRDLRALGLDLREVLEDGIQLRLNVEAVRGECSRFLVEEGRLLDLVLHILLLRHLLDRIVLRLLLIGREGGLFGGHDLGEVLAEVALDNLQEADDAGAGARGRDVRRVLGVVVVQDLQRQLNAVEALLQVGLGGRVHRVLLSAQFVHLGLGVHELRQGALKHGHLLLERRGLGGHLVDLRGELLHLGRLLGLLRIRFRELLVTIHLVRGVGGGLVLEFLDHV